MIVIRARRGKLATLFVLSLGMVACSVWISWRQPFPLLLVSRPAGALGILFFGVAGGWILSRLFSHRVSVILHRDGLLDNSTAFPAGPIAWEHISRVEITSVLNERFVGIDIKDRTALPSSSSPFRRFIDDANTGIPGLPVHIPTPASNRPLQQ